MLFKNSFKAASIPKRAAVVSACCIRTNFNNVASVASKVVAIFSLIVSKNALCSTLNAIPFPTKVFKLVTTSACFTNGEAATLAPISQDICFQ
jgi:hypothetical protein